MNSRYSGVALGGDLIKHQAWSLLNFPPSFYDLTAVTGLPLSQLLVVRSLCFNYFASERISIAHQIPTF